MLLKDKVAVITGGAGQNGLGFATARMMAEHGARVVILDLAVAEPQAAAARLGAQHLGLVADVTDKASCEAAAAQIKAAMGGRIDTHVRHKAGKHDTVDISGFQLLVKIGIDKGIGVIFANDGLTRNRFNFVAKCAAIGMNIIG